MRRSSRVPMLTLPVLLMAIGATHAGTSPEAQQWLDKMHAAYEKGPFRVDYKAQMNTEKLGQPMNVTLEGESIHKDSTHMHMELNVKMGLGTTNLDMSVLQISDGKLLWMEMNNPVGVKQVMKISVDRAGHIAAAGGALGGGSVDPIGQIRDMTKKFDFQLAGITDGLVTLNATLTEKARAELSGTPPLAEAMSEITIVLDEKTAAPKEMRIGGESPFLTVQLESFQYLDKVEDSLFVYTPPTGVQVMDLDEMLQESKSPGEAEGDGLEPGE